MRRLYSGLLFTVILTASCVHRHYDDEVYDDVVVDEPQFENLEIVAVADEPEVVDEQFIHQYGVTVPKYHWDEAGQKGQVIRLLRDGVICKQSYYLGLLEGETTYTFPYSDQIERVEVYSQDMLRKDTQYYPSGQQRVETIYHPSEPTQRREWYENGQQKSYEKFTGGLLSHADYYGSHGELISNIQEGDGQRIVRDNYGLMIMEDTFKDGKVEYRTTYYPNGAPKEITPYRFGIVEGLRKTYYPGGEPNVFETWVGGRQEGITTIYEDGQKTQEVPYTDGLKNGRGKVFKDGAIVIQEPTWKDDMLHGPCITTIDGRRTTEWYYKGRKVTKGYYDSFTQFTPVN